MVAETRVNGRDMHLRGMPCPGTRRRQSQRQTTLAEEHRQFQASTDYKGLQYSVVRSQEVRNIDAFIAGK